MSWEVLEEIEREENAAASKLDEEEEEDEDEDEDDEVEEENEATVVRGCRAATTGDLRGCRQGGLGAC